MKKLTIAPILAALTLPGICLSATPPRPQEAGCSSYFGVLQDDPNAPGRFVARMSSSQANWFAKNGSKQYPGLCLSLEKARYLVVWAVSTETRTFETTQTRTAQVDTTSNGQEQGTFSTYGSLSTWGTYSGTSSSTSTSTVSYQETVPVSVTAQHCSLYVLKSVGPTIWDDIRTKTPQPPVAFSTEARGPNRASGGGGSPGTTAGIVIGTGISHLVRREPTTHALNTALEFISAQPLTPSAPLEVSALQASLAPNASSPASPPVSFKSSPDGAEVWVDGKYVGSTPSLIPLTPGDHEIEIAKPGFRGWRRKVSITAGGQVTIDAALEKETPQ